MPAILHLFTGTWASCPRFFTLHRDVGILPAILHSSLFTIHFRCFLDGLIITRQRSERRKLGSTVPHRHLLMPIRNMMRQVDYVIVITHNSFFTFDTSPQPSPKEKGLRRSRFFTFHSSLFTLASRQPPPPPRGGSGWGSYFALCPPICSLRSLAVAPSSKFRPLRMAFLPKRCLIFNWASCIRRSLSSFACSS